MKATGIGKEFSDWVQANILDYGHEVEALARPLVEAIIDDDLYPVTCSLGHLSASCDGLTMSEAVAFEHKQWNATLAAAVGAGELPDEHAPQCQQILMVTGAEKLIFVVSDGTPENMVHMWVYPDAAWFERLVAGWEQFDLDVAAYVPAEPVEKPTAKVIMALPALVVQTRGEVMQSNLPQFEAAATAFIATIKTELATDEDFVNADADVKFCQRAEDDLEHAKSAVMGQATTIDQVMKTIDKIKEQLRAKRLALGKLIDSKKLQIKEGILAAAKLAYTDHIEKLEAEIKPLRLPAGMPDFAGAVKGKRTLATMQDAADTLLASAKISTNTTAADYRAKQAWCKENAAGFGHLFMDMAQIIGKPIDDFQLVVRTRIADHERAEAAKQEALRAKIAAEEKAKAEAAAAAQLAEQRRADAERQAAEAQAERNRVAAETKAQMEQQAATLAAQRASKAAADRAAVTAQPTRESALATAHQSIAQEKAAALADQGQLTDLANAQVDATATDDLFSTASTTGAVNAQTPPALRLGQIVDRLGFGVTASFLESLGFGPAETAGAAKLYHEADFPRMCAALSRHVAVVQAKYSV
jgi:predicted phage-related endonuclease